MNSHAPRDAEAIIDCLPPHRGEKRRYTPLWAIVIAVLACAAALLLDLWLGH
jgi:hypothetical protein